MSFSITVSAFLVKNTVVYKESGLFESRSTFDTLSDKSKDFIQQNGVEFETFDLVCILGILLLDLGVIIVCLSTWRYIAMEFLPTVLTSESRTSRTLSNTRNRSLGFVARTKHSPTQTDVDDVNLAQVISDIGAIPVLEDSRGIEGSIDESNGGVINKLTVIIQNIEPLEIACVTGGDGDNVSNDADDDADLMSPPIIDWSEVPEGDADLPNIPEWAVIPDWDFNRMG